MWASARWFTTHIGSRLILALAQVDDMPEKAVRRPFGETNLYDHFRSHPMDPTEHEW
jgi:hypothetical protein